MMNKQNTNTTKQNNEKKTDNRIYEIINRMSKEEFDKFASRILLDCKKL